MPLAEGNGLDTKLTITYEKEEPTMAERRHVTNGRETDSTDHESSQESSPHKTETSQIIGDTTLKRLLRVPDSDDRVNQQESMCAKSLIRESRV